MAKKKYDTNPLDPEFPQRAQEAQTETLPYSGAQTNPFPYAAPTEEQTRRFADADFSAYSTATFDGQSVPQNFRAAASLDDMNRASSRSVPKIGLPEKWLVGLPYIPWYPGLIASVILLFVVPRSEAKVRFHAAQALAAHIAIFIVGAILSGAGNFAGFGSAAGIFKIVMTIMLLVFAVKAWRGKPVHIESVNDLTNWLEEKIKPRP